MERNAAGYASAAANIGFRVKGPLNPILLSATPRSVTEIDLT